jgi:hypothetical protein
MLGFIGRVVDDFTLAQGEYAQLPFGEDAFTIPLAADALRPREALHIVGVDEDGRTDASHLWIW